jgi:SPX domain protein involved in polyphosphate accumulation
VTSGTKAPVSAITEGKKKQFEMPSVLERFESKYTIPCSMIDEISAFIAPYCSLDKYSEKSPTLFYRINSLYFDTPYFLFLRQRLRKVEKRFNMRIRSYGDHPTMPYFFEIKQRRGDIIKKYRSKLSSGSIEEILHAPNPVHFDDDEEIQFENRALFHRTVHYYNARPVVLVQYLRKAYVADYEDYARVTFDIGLRYMAPSDYNPIPREESMVPADIQGRFDSGCNIVLELKCYTSFVPLWMVDLVRTFDLKRRSFSKYANCVQPLLGRYDSGGGFLREPAIGEYFVEDD